jgi:methylmalonyl-CoA mutase N-terminal domain/subunit
VTRGEEPGGAAGSPGAGSGRTPRRERTTSGIEIADVYRPPDVADGLGERLGEPGEYPYTRGIHATGYRGRPWTMRQYAGFTSAEESNRRYHSLLAGGQSGLSVAFDLPTQMGYDSDDPRVAGEVGRVGVPIDSVHDMERLFDGIDLGAVSTSMTINATAAILLALYEAVGRRQGVDPARMRGTVQNDILKEYVARGTYIFPPQPSLRLATDLIAYCRSDLPQFNPISISGYHMREAGATAVQELAYTMGNAVAYADAAVAAGLAFDDFAPRLSFFFAAHNDLFEEVAKFRAARRLWARIARDRYGAADPRSMTLRFHVQTAGSTLTAQQPETNTVRTTVQALAAVLGGAQSLHTNALDEALGLPSPEAARLALRTQQVLAHETGLIAPIDPLGGSWYVEALTDALDERATAELARLDEQGGPLAALEAGYQAGAIADAAYADQRAFEAGESVVVGVNVFAEAGETAGRPEPQRIDPEAERRQADRTAAVRANRDSAGADAALVALETAARGTENLLPRIRACVEADVTLGEIADRLRRVWGEHRP